MILGLAANATYTTSILQCPTGVYKLVGTIPAYMDRLIFQTETIAELALEEATRALETRHVDPGALFCAISTAAPKERRAGSFHLKKVLVTTDMI